jgi:hypothetical protein
MCGEGCHSWPWIIFLYVPPYPSHSALLSPVKPSLKGPGTSSIDTYSYTLPGQNRRIHLIDTPGFNDTNRSDIETLSMLASYLGASYANVVSIHGILIIHPITDNRMSGSTMRNVEMMKKMCGWASYQNLVVAPTMWPPRDSHYILGRPFICGWEIRGTSETPWRNARLSS